MEEDEPIEETKITTVTDGVFTMTVGPSNLNSESSGFSNVKPDVREIFTPSPRMNCSMTVKNGLLYLYGGLVEDNDKQFTLADMYSLGELQNTNNTQTISF